MTRLARIVVPGIPHHITQRGNRRMKVFFSDDDYRFYIELMKQGCEKHHVEIVTYCLMPNHVHLIAIPAEECSLRLAIGEAHRRYTLHINSREEWQGHLWQGRFASFPLDEAHFLAACRYAELNPVRAGIVRQPEDWCWSSAKAHLEGKDDSLISVKPLLRIVEDWRSFLYEQIVEDELELLRKHSRTGRPLGGKSFIERLERSLKRRLKKKKPGPKRRESDN